MLKDIRLIAPQKCSADEKVIDVAKKLKESTQRYIYVVDENDWPIGIISTTDINNKVVAEGKDANALTAKDIMSQPIEVYDINDDEVNVYKEMVENKRFGCAVVENKKLIGVVSLKDLITHITSEGK